MRVSMFCFLTALALLLCGCAHPQQPVETVDNVPVVDSTPLAAGDCITVAFNVGGPLAGKPKATTYVLDSSGDISMPHVSKLHLGGLTLQQAAEQIEQANVPNEQDRFHIASVKRCR